MNIAAPYMIGSTTQVKSDVGTVLPSNRRREREHSAHGLLPL